MFKYLKNVNQSVPFSQSSLSSVLFIDLILIQHSFKEGIHLDSLNLLIMILFYLFHFLHLLLDLYSSLIQTEPFSYLR